MNSSNKKYLYLALFAIILFVFYYYYKTTTTVREGNWFTKHLKKKNAYNIYQYAMSKLAEAQKKKREEHEKYHGEEVEKECKRRKQHVGRRGEKRDKESCPLQMSLSGGSLGRMPGARDKSFVLWREKGKDGKPSCVELAHNLRYGGFHDCKYMTVDDLKAPPYG